jgi:hypothetical protein
MGAEMDAFEQVVSDILWMEGHWVQTSVKVELTKQEKVLIGRRTSPRWELDIVAYQGGPRVLRVVECKSYIDSRGVSIAALDGSNAGLGKRFKLFNDERLREVVFRRLKTQLVERGACPLDVDVRLCLACGRIATAADAIELKRLFATRGWELWDSSWLRERLEQMSNGKYENQVSAVVSKLLLRKGGS